MDPRHPKKGTATTELPPAEVSDRELNKGRAPEKRRPPRRVPSRQPTAVERATIRGLRPPRRQKSRADR